MDSRKRHPVGVRVRRPPILIFLLLVIIVTLLTTLVVCMLTLWRTISDSSTEKVMMCTKFVNSPALAEDFRTNQINQTSKFMVADPDFNLCTHLICSDTYMQSTKDAVWTEDQKSQYKECVGLRTTYPHLKILYGVKYSPSEYYEMAGDLKKRRAFITRVFDIVADNNFDGLNLIWQHSSENYPMDANSLLDEQIPSLVRELKHAFKLNDLMFVGTFAKRIVAVLPKNMMTDTTEWRGDIRLLKMYDLVTIANDLDYVVVESLHTDEIDDLIKLGVPVKKILIKIPQMRTRVLHETEAFLPLNKRFIMDIVESAASKHNPKIGGALVDVLIKNATETELQIITEAFDEQRKWYGVNWIFMDYYDIKVTHIEENAMKESKASKSSKEKKDIIGNVFKFIG